MLYFVLLILTAGTIHAPVHFYKIFLKDSGRFMNRLKKWLRSATKEQRSQLATVSRLSKQFIYQLSEGLRKITPETAGKLEEATKKIQHHIIEVSPEQKLPEILTRGEICRTCSNCAYYKNYKD